MDTAAPMPTNTPAASRCGGAPATPRATAGAEAGGSGFGAELRRAVGGAAKNEPRADGDAPPRDEASPDRSAAPPSDSSPAVAAPVAQDPPATPLPAPSEASGSTLPPAAAPTRTGGSAASPEGCSAATPAVEPSIAATAGDGAASALLPVAAEAGGGSTGAETPPQAPTAAQGTTAPPPGAAPAAATRAAAPGEADGGPGVQRGAPDAAPAGGAEEATARPALPQDAPGAPEAPLFRAAEAPSAERSSPALSVASTAPDAAARNPAASAPAATTQTAAAEPPPTAAAPRPPPPPPVRQVAPIAIALALGTGGAPRLTVALEPEELGRVEIRVERGGAGDGEASRVRVVAERPETLALLQRDARQLDRALQGAGIALAEGGMQFSLAGREGGGAAGDGTRNNGGGAARQGRGGETPEAALQPAPARRGAAAGVSLLDIAI